MSKILDAARRSVSRKAETLSRRQARVQAVNQLAEHRKTVAQARVESAQAAVVRSEESVAKLEQRLAAARERLLAAEQRLEQSKVRASEVEQATKHHTRKVENAVLTAREKLADANARVEVLEQVETAPTTRTVKPAGEVESELGDTRCLTKEAVDTVKRIIGTRRSGCLQPLDGADAISLLNAIDNGRHSVGDTFELRIHGRRTKLLFSVESDGLHYVAISSSLVAS